MVHKRGVIIGEKTLQELRSLPRVTLYCEVTMIVMFWGSQLSEMSKISQLLWDCYLRVFSKCLQNPSLRVFSKCTIQVPKDTIFDKSNTEENWQHSQNNDTLLHSGRPHRWLQVPSVQHSQAHIPTSIEELKIDYFEITCFHETGFYLSGRRTQLTWVWLCVFVQEGGALDWNLLHLTSPGTMGQVARVWASFPWKIVVSSQLLKRLINLWGS